MSKYSIGCLDEVIIHCIRHYKDIGQVQNIVFILSKMGGSVKIFKCKSIQ